MHRVALDESLAEHGLACVFQTYKQPRKLRILKTEKLFGFLPKIVYRPVKGCHLGRVVNLEESKNAAS